MLIGVLRTGKENPEIMARGYVIGAASLDGEVDITDAGLKISIDTPNCLFEYYPDWDTSTIDDTLVA